MLSQHEHFDIANLAPWLAGVAYRRGWRGRAVSECIGLRTNSLAASRHSRPSVSGGIPCEWHMRRYTEVAVGLSRVARDTAEELTVVCSYSEFGFSTFS